MSMDPNDLNSLEGEDSEYTWGYGLFPPGIADNEGQLEHQDDFGDNLDPQTNKIGDVSDNYARAVADRRTDPTDPDSNRDFNSAGNPDRFGGQPPLVRDTPQPNRTDGDPYVERRGVDRKW